MTRIMRRAFTAVMSFLLVALVAALAVPAAAAPAEVVVLPGAITSDLFQVPATAARFGSRLAVVNAKFDTGFPPTAGQYEVVLVDR